MNDMETRIFRDLELKAASYKDDSVKRFEGYLAYFDNVDSYGDVIVKGAFADTLKDIKKEGKTIPVLEQHGGWGISSGDYTPIGYYESLEEDEKGLYVKGVLFDTQRGSDIYTLLKQAPKGAMGQSIGYRVISRKDATDEEYRATGVKRFLLGIKLYEGSIVTFPANDKARVDDVKMSEAKKLRGIEEHFRKNGFSASEAKKAIALLKSYEGNMEVIEDQVKEETPSIFEAFKSFTDQLERERIVAELKKALSEFPLQVKFGNAK